jgi:hypothetical protein
MRLALLGAIILTFTAARPANCDQPIVDLELVLAVDASGSINRTEALLQREGYVAALTDPEFLSAISRGARGRIAVTYLEWAGADQQWQVVPWAIIATAEDAERFAAQIPAPRIVNQRGTSIANAALFGLSLLDDNAIDGARRVIDISGDGPNNGGATLALARSEAVRRNVTINGLPIIGGDQAFPGIVDYYRDCVIAGDGAFVLPAGDMSEFAASIRRKLIFEVIGETGSDQPPATLAAGADCLIGEKNRNRWIDRFFPKL